MILRTLAPVNMEDDSIHPELLAASRVASVSDDGRVVLQLPSGSLYTASVPRRSVPILRRLMELQREGERYPSGRRRP